MRLPSGRCTVARMREKGDKYDVLGRGGTEGREVLTVAATFSSNLRSGSLFMSLYNSPLPANSSMRKTLPSS